jgi:hypothetical protein
MQNPSFEKFSILEIYIHRNTKNFSHMIYEYEYSQKQKALDMGKCNGKGGVSK